MSLNIVHLASKKDYSHFDIYRAKESGGYQIDFINLTAFLHERGYFIHRVNVTKYIYIRIVDNIVKEVGKIDIKKEILDFIITEKNRSIHEFFIKNINKATADEFLETLESKEIDFRRDGKSYVDLYFSNCIARITRDGIEEIPYSKMVGFIWESQIIQREFKRVPENPKKPGDFKVFCWNISAKSQERYNSICSALGFLVHNYKNPVYCPAIILNDEVISDNPEGGTGKGLLIKAIQQFARTITIEGKTFSFEKSFLYQRVNADSKIICFQDVNKSFDFERLFSVLTDGIEVEKKGLGSVMIEFEESPKIVITTNYAIRGDGNSHERRRFELEISQYYNSERTPITEFKKVMFKEWDKNEWSLFDNFIVDCCQFYLRKGLVKQELIHLEEKRLMAQTSKDFIDFMETFDFQTIRKSELYDNFLKEYTEYHKQKWFTKQLLSKWVAAYCRFKGYDVSDYIYLSERYYKFEKLQTL
jgi:hypothetical protein